jgi:hypothetical protein
MERLADVWQLSEQLRCGVAFACDANTCSGGPCRGWNEFSNDALARFCADILGTHAVVSDHLPFGKDAPPTLV